MESSQTIFWQEAKCRAASLELRAISKENNVQGESNINWYITECPDKYKAHSAN